MQDLAVQQMEHQGLSGQHALQEAFVVLVLELERERRRA
jgi:hypothetical protein